MYSFETHDYKRHRIPSDVDTNSCDKHRYMLHMITVVRVWKNWPKPSHKGTRKEIKFSSQEENVFPL